MNDAGGSRRVRVGVTGHRSIANPDGVRAAVDAVLARVAGDAELVVVSSLAEGADRLVAEQALARGGSLVALLPLIPSDYLADFVEDGSAGRFWELLDLADEVEVVVAPDDADHTREAAYERAGLAVLDACDVLLALWDGGLGRGRGSTASLVAQARRQRMPIEEITVQRSDGGS